jgi:hypothetical protein
MATGLVIAGVLAVLAPGPGHSVPLDPVRKHSGCHGTFPIADRACTPGARYTGATREVVCRPSFKPRARPIPSRRAEAVFRAYGIGKRSNRRAAGLERLVPLGLGGTDARANLFPKPVGPPPSVDEKRELGIELRRLVCAGQLGLRTAQNAIAKDWVAAHAKYVRHLPDDEITPTDGNYGMFSAAGNRAAARLVDAVIEKLKSRPSMREVNALISRRMEAIADAGHKEIYDTAVRDLLYLALEQPVERAGLDPEELRFE